MFGLSLEDLAGLELIGARLLNKETKYKVFQLVLVFSQIVELGSRVPRNLPTEFFVRLVKNTYQGIFCMTCE